MYSHFDITDKVFETKEKSIALFFFCFSIAIVGVSDRSLTIKANVYYLTIKDK